MTSRRLHNDRGAVAAMMVVLATTFLVLIGLVYDGSRILAARRDATNVALQSARVGAQQLDLDAAHIGTFEIDLVAADVAARDWLGAQSIEPVEIQVTPDEIRVTVAIETETPLLSLVGISSRTVTGTATAVPARGVTEEE